MFVTGRHSSDDAAMTPLSHPARHADEPETVGSMIHLHTLGDTLIKIGEREIRPTSPMLFAALLYLGIERGRRVPRTALQEMLFPKVDERSGAHSLRQLLYKLRQLGAPIESDASSVVLDADVVHDDAASVLEFTNGQAKLAAKYALGLLPDYSPNLSERYEEWLEHQRATVASRVRRQLVAAMSASRESIDWKAVEQFAQLVLQIDPFNEEATLALAEATALSGSKRQAVTMLSRYEAETGRSDLKLSATVLRRRISEHLPAVGLKRGRAPFVGRASERELIRKAITDAKAGRPCLITLYGEAGIGKTRLLEETASLAALEGVRVQFGRCQRRHAERPFGVFLEIVPALLNFPGALGISPEMLDHLKLFVNHSDNRLARPSDSQDDASRSGVIRAAFRDLVESIQAEAPLLIAIEDAHWADKDSLRELSDIVGQRAHNRLIILFTARSLERIRESVSFHDPLVVRRLQALPDDRMLELAGHFFGEQACVPSDIASWCVRAASGNPLFLQTVCEQYLATGQAFAVPPDLIAATQRRLDTLHSKPRRLLELCALLGKHCSIDALRETVDCSRMELVDSVQELEDGGYLRLTDGLIQVSHDLISDCALGSLHPITRRLQHRIVASYLEHKFESTNDASSLWDCAEQWSLSGESSKAVEFLKQCAAHAADMGQASQALGLLNRAKEFAVSPDQKVDLLENIMKTSKAAGAWPLALNASLELSALLPHRVSCHSETELLSIESLWMMRYESGGVMDRLLDCVSSQSAADAHRLDAAVLLFRIAHERSDFILAKSVFEAVQSFVSGAGDSYSKRMIPLIYHASFGSHAEAIRVAQEITKDLSSLNPITLRFRAAINIGTALSFVGDRDQAVAVFAQFYEEAARCGLSDWAWDFAASASLQHVEAEDYALAEEWLSRAGQFCTTTSGTALRRKHLACACEIALAHGDLFRAREFMHAIVQLGGAESVRVRAYHECFELRVQLLDPSAQPSVGELEKLFHIYELARSSVGMDFFVTALIEGLRRVRRTNEALAIFNDYTTVYRRERSPLPPSLMSALNRCKESLL